MTTVNSAHFNKLSAVQSGKSYEGFDASGSVQWCTPTCYKFGLCIGATAIGSELALVLAAKSPFGTHSKTFKITKDVNFDWSPFPVVKFVLEIDKFKSSGGYLSFNLTVKIGVRVPVLGWKYVSYDKDFHIKENASLEAVPEVSDSDLGMLMAMPT